jgi:hypothetical protein
MNSEIWREYDRGRLEKKDGIFKTISIALLNVGCLAMICVMGFMIYALACVPKP